jgi:hypothetical protein
VAPDPRNQDFATQGFEHGVHHKFAKREIAMRLGTRLTVTAQGHMEAELNEGGLLIERWSARFFEGVILAIGLKRIQPLIQGGPFHDFGHRDVGDQEE